MSRATNTLNPSHYDEEDDPDIPSTAFLDANNDLDEDDDMRRNEDNAPKIEIASIMSSYQLQETPLDGWKMNLCACSMAHRSLYIASIHRILVYTLSSRGLILPHIKPVSWPLKSRSPIDCVRFGYYGNIPILCVVDWIGKLTVFPINQPHLTHPAATPSTISPCSHPSSSHYQYQQMLTNELRDWNDQSAWSIAITPKGCPDPCVIVGSNAHRLFVWRLFGDPTVTMANNHSNDDHAHNIPSVDISSDGSRIATASIDQHVRILTFDNRTTTTTTPQPSSSPAPPSLITAYTATLQRQWGWSVRWFPALYVYHDPRTAKEKAKQLEEHRQKSRSRNHPANEQKTDAGQSSSPSSRRTIVGPVVALLRHAVEDGGGWLQWFGNLLQQEQLGDRDQRLLREELGQRQQLLRETPNEVRRAEYERADAMDDDDDENEYENEELEEEKEDGNDEVDEDEDEEGDMPEDEGDAIRRAIVWEHARPYREDGPIPDMQEDETDEDTDEDIADIPQQQQQQQAALQRPARNGATAATPSSYQSLPSSSIIPPDLLLYATKSSLFLLDSSLNALHVVPHIALDTLTHHREIDRLAFLDVIPELSLILVASSAGDRVLLYRIVHYACGTYRMEWENCIPVLASGHIIKGLAVGRIGEDSHKDDIQWLGSYPAAPVYRIPLSAATIDEGLESDCWCVYLLYSNETVSAYQLSRSAVAGRVFDVTQMII